ncbi:MAG: hypothetical protein HQK84_07265 [Nitrospinae bacterium]|nr:hypothetical protein [Nitrospinota bacterium]
MEITSVDEKIISFINTRIKKYFPEIKKIKDFEYDVKRYEYFDIYAFFINSHKKPQLEVKTSSLSFGKQYLTNEVENINLLRKQKGFPEYSIQKPLEIFEVEGKTGVALTYLSGHEITHLNDSIIRDSIIPWLIDFHTSTKTELRNPENYIESMLFYHEVFFNIGVKEKRFIERLKSFIKKNKMNFGYYKHDDFDLENMVINGKKLRVKNFYYPLVPKLPMGELFSLYEHHYKKNQKKGLEKVFSFFNASEFKFVIDRKFLELVDPYLEALDINKAAINYLFFIHWVDYANNVCSELIRMTPDIHEILEDGKTMTFKDKVEFWKKMKKIHNMELDLVNGTPAIFGDLL